MSEFIRHPSGRKFTAAEFQAEVRSRVSCPTCSVEPGEFCVHPFSGQRRQRNHWMRVEAVTGQERADAVKKMRAKHSLTAGKRRPVSRGWV